MVDLEVAIADLVVDAHVTTSAVEHPGEVHGRERHRHLSSEPHGLTALGKVAVDDQDAAWR